MCTGANAQGQRACDWWQRNGKENAAKIFKKKKMENKSTFNIGKSAALHFRSYDGTLVHKKE